jgi:hypothetical protein
VLDRYRISSSSRSTGKTNEPIRTRVDEKPPTAPRRTTKPDPTTRPSSAPAPNRPSLDEIRGRIAKEASRHDGDRRHGHAAVDAHRDRASHGIPRSHDHAQHGRSGDKHVRTLRVTDSHTAKNHPHKPSHDPRAMRFHDRVDAGHFHHLVQGEIAKNLGLADQYHFARHGDIARRMDPHKHHHDTHHHSKHHPGHGPAKAVHHATVHARHHYPVHASFHHRPSHYQYHGRIHSHYWHNCRRFHTFAPSYYPRHCWYPHWTDWVHWAWGLRPRVVCDPRPVYCRPIAYAPVVTWTYYSCPTWTTLPAVSSGTWVDVPSVAAGSQYDLQLLAVRFVDPGHPQQQLGPRFRVWFRNNSDLPLTQPFDVMMFASQGDELTTGLPQAGVQVTSVEAGDTQSVDVRLPYDVYSTENGPSAFQTLHVLVDANRALAEKSETNNGTRVALADVLPVDPAAFELEPVEAAAGSEVIIAGEGFGPEAGQVLLHLGGVEMEAEILGWYDLGVRVAMPKLPLAGPTKAELVVIRGDKAAANPLTITLLPPQYSLEPIPPNPFE